MSFEDKSRYLKLGKFEKSADSRDDNLLPLKLMYSSSLDPEMISVGKKVSLFPSRFTFLSLRWMLNELG